jgi:hypothetical protein
MKDYESRQDMLKDLLRPGATLAEIGVFVGEFSDWMAKTLTPKKLYGVDPYSSTNGMIGCGNVDGFGMEYFENELLFGFVKNRMSIYPEYEHRRVSSSEFFNSIDDGSLDAVYLDGDQSLDTVRNDLELARHAVKEEGWIFGQSYALHPEKGNREINHVVESVVNEFCKKHGLSVHAVTNDGIRSFAIQNTKKYKICIVSVSDRSDLYSNTFLLMNRYAHKHGYATRLFTHVLEKDRHPSWSKIPALKLIQKEGNYDYIVWMDDDIVITNPEIPLSHFIDTHNFRKSPASILVSADMPNEPSTHMNCGILFLKTSNDMSTKLLDFAWNYGEMCPITKQNVSWEQEAFNFAYRFGSREDFLIVPLPNFQAPARFQSNPLVSWKPGYFSAHLNNGPLPVKLQTLHLLHKLCNLFG